MYETKILAPIKYFLFVSVVFVVMCIVMGHPTWIVKIFIES